MAHSEKRLKEIYDFVTVNGITEAALKFGIKEASVRVTISNYKKLTGAVRERKVKVREEILSKVEEGKVNEVTFKQNNDGADLSGQATSLKELLEKANIDLDVWEVETFEIKQNSWDVTMKNKDNDLTWKDGVVNGYAKHIPGGLTKTNKQFYIKARLKKRTDFTATQKFKEEMVNELKTFSRKVKQYKYDYEKLDSGNILEITIPDLHLGKQSWAEETGFRNYNAKIAIARFQKAIDEMFAKAIAEDKFERILFVIGNDLFNSDTAYPYTATTAGTPMQDDTRWQKVFRHGRQLMIENIRKFSQVAPVTVLVIPGNHDFQKTFYLGEVLEAFFYNDENVTIDNSPRTRKYFKWGKCLLGFAHGSGKDEGITRLLNNMKHECAVEWADTVYREFHCGDIHHYKEVRQRGSSKDVDLYAEDIDGVVIKYLRTLMFNDEWEAKKGFISQKGAHMFVWNKEAGNTKEHKYNKYE